MKDSKLYIAAFILLAGFFVAACKNNLAYSESTQSKGVADKTHSVAQTDISFCGNSNKILFGFNDKHHTQFLIPEAYLDNPYKIYHKVKDPAELINIRVNKKDLSPKCNKIIGTLDSDIRITIKPYRQNMFYFIRQTHQRTKPKYIGVENGAFDLFRRDAVDEKKWETEDFLVPLDQEYKDSFFADCVYTLPSNPPFKRVGCGIYSAPADTFYIRYSIKSEDLLQYKNIDQNIRKLILSFVSSPENLLPYKEPSK